MKKSFAKLSLEAVGSLEKAEGHVLAPQMLPRMRASGGKGKAMAAVIECWRFAAVAAAAPACAAAVAARAPAAVSLQSLKRLAVWGWAGSWA